MGPACSFSRHHFRSEICLSLVCIMIRLLYHPSFLLSLLTLFDYGQHREIHFSLKWKRASTVGGHLGSLSLHHGVFVKWSKLENWIPSCKMLQRLLQLGKLIRDWLWAIKRMQGWDSLYCYATLPILQGRAPCNLITSFIHLHHHHST